MQSWDAGYTTPMMPSCPFLKETLINTINTRIEQMQKFDLKLWITKGLELQ